MKGWYKDSYRHYLAAKGISTRRYNAQTKFGKALSGGLTSGITTLGQTAVGSRDPTTESGRRVRSEILAQRAAIVSAPGVKAKAAMARASLERQLTPAEQSFRLAIGRAVKAGESEGEFNRRKLVESAIESNMQREIKRKERRETINSKLIDLNSKYAAAEGEEKVRLGNEIRGLKAIERSIDEDSERDTRALINYAQRPKSVVLVGDSEVVIPVQASASDFALLEGGK